MKRIIYVLILLMSCSMVEARDFYQAVMQQNGTLYFVFPQRMPVLNAYGRQGMKQLDYDYTYLDSRDSVSMLMTVECNMLCQIDHATITYGNGKTISSDVEILYCDKKKLQWVHRIGIKFTQGQWNEVYSQLKPFTLTLVDKNGMPIAAFSDKVNNWGKIRTQYSDLMTVIRLNKKP